MGSATVYQLARSGCKVLGLEQFTVPHAFGSSHGSTRIIRLAYSEGPRYVPLLRAAYRYWRELEEVSGESILRVTGGLDIGPPGSRIIEGSRRTCLEHGIHFEELDGGEISRRFPGYRLPESLRAIYQAGAGYVRSEVAIRAHAAAARDLGAEIVTDSRVRGWEKRSSGFRVDTASGSYEASKLVFTAGAWAGQLVPELAPLCQPERQVMLWTETQKAALFEPETFPIFVLHAPPGCYYGFPNDRGEGFKIGKYHHRLQPVPDPRSPGPGMLPGRRSCRARGNRSLLPGGERPHPPHGGVHVYEQPRRALHPGPPPGHGRRVHRGRLLRARLQVLQRDRPDHGGLLPRTGGEVGDWGVWVGGGAVSRSLTGKPTRGRLRGMCILSRNGLVLAAHGMVVLTSDS